MYLSSITLAFMACLHMAVAVNLHGHPIVTRLQYFLDHHVPTGMCPKGAFMYFHYNLVCFDFSYAFEQDRIIISFVHYPSTQEGLGQEILKVLLVHDGRILRILLAFQVSQDVIEPGMAIRLIFGCQTIGWFVQVVNVDIWCLIFPFNLKHG